MFSNGFMREETKRKIDEADRAVLEQLDGKYLVFNFREADYEDEVEVLRIYRLIRGKLKEFFIPEPHPLLGVSSMISETFADDENGHGIDQSEFGVRLLVEKGIKEVVTLKNGSRELFGIPDQFVITSEEQNRKGEYECWYEFVRYLNPEQIRLLTKYKLEIVGFDLTKKEFIKNPESAVIDENAEDQGEYSLV